MIATFQIIIGILVLLAFRFLFFPRPGRTFDDYRRSRPDLAIGGKVMCRSCGGSSIWMKRVARSPFGSLYRHTCRTCGAELYESSGA